VQPFYWLEYTKQQLPEIDVPEGYEDPPLDDRLWLRESQRVQLLPPSSRDLSVIDEPLNRVAERYVRRRSE